MVKNKSLADALHNTSSKNLPESKIPNAGQKQLIVQLDIAAHQQLKAMSVEHNSSLKALACEAIDDLFVKYGKPPIAGSNRDKKI